MAQFGIEDSPRFGCTWWGRVYVQMHFTVFDGYLAQGSSTTRSSLTRLPSLRPAMWNNPLFHWHPAHCGITCPRDVLCFTHSHVLARHSFASRPQKRPACWRERVKTSLRVNVTEGLPAGSKWSAHPDLRQAPCIKLPAMADADHVIFFVFFFVNLQYFYREIMGVQSLPLSGAELRLESVGNQPRRVFDLMDCRQLDDFLK